LRQTVCFLGKKVSKNILNTKKVAFIKFAGLSNGGTEKYLQSLAVIAKDMGFHVDYFYTNAAPFTNGWAHPDNDPARKEWLESHGVNLIPIHVDYKIGDREPYEWMGTDLWENFDEDNYAFVQTARGGYPEYPFNLINKTPIIDSIHSTKGEDKENVHAAILLSKWQATEWANNGGNINKAKIIPPFVPVPSRNSYQIGKYKHKYPNKVVYGFHQAARDEIFSPVSLMAYNNLNLGDSAHFLIMGGSDQYKRFVEKFNIPNVDFINFSSDSSEIHSFLSSLDVYVHGRADGEVCSACLIEAMYHGLPIITHISNINSGHVSQISQIGNVCYSNHDYENEMQKHLNIGIRYLFGSLARKEWEEVYSPSSVKCQIESLYSSFL